VTGAAEWRRELLYGRMDVRSGSGRNDERDRSTEPAERERDQAGTPAPDWPDLPDGPTHRRATAANADRHPPPLHHLGRREPRAPAAATVDRHPAPVVRRVPAEPRPDAPESEQSRMCRVRAPSSYTKLETRCGEPRDLLG